MALALSDRPAPSRPLPHDPSHRVLPRREHAVLRRRLVDAVLTESLALHAIQVRLHPLLDATPPGEPLPVEVIEALDNLDATLSRLAAASEALDRLDAGTYGTCERCDGPVAVVRLLADPATPRCPTCLAA